MSWHVSTLQVEGWPSEMNFEHRTCNSSKSSWRCLTGSVHISDINPFYDEGMYHRRVTEYYGQSDFYYFGYWLEDTPSQKDTCENLIEKPLAFIPERKGTILDVACGNGKSEIP